MSSLDQRMQLKTSLHQHSRKRPARDRPKRRSRLALILPLLCLSLWVGYRKTQALLMRPDAMLVLGGSPDREVFAADFARQHPHLDIWVSSGSNPEYAEWVFDQAGIEPERIHLDYQAVDTVTNFTTLVDELQARKIDSVYLITSEDHMRRAQVIGEIVLGSRNISFKPIAVPSTREPEPIEKAVRDGARAVLWLATGRTGTTLSRWLPPKTQLPPDS